MAEETRLIEQRLEQLEKDTKERFGELQSTVKDLEGRVNNHDVSIAKIELMVEGLKNNWATLELTIKQALEGQQESQEMATSAWKEVTIEAIKAISIVAGAILAAKILL